MSISSTLTFINKNDTFTPIEGQTYETMTPIDTAIGINNTADLMNALNVSTSNDVDIDGDGTKDAILGHLRTERFIKKALLQFGLEKNKINSYRINELIKNNDKADIGDKNVGITESELVTILSVLE